MKYIIIHNIEDKQSKGNLLQHMVFCREDVEVELQWMTSRYEEIFDIPKRILPTVIIPVPDYKYIMMIIRIHWLIRYYCNYQCWILTQVQESIL
jgi:hypothetical protein